MRYMAKSLRKLTTVRIDLITKNRSCPDTMIQFQKVLKRITY